MIWQKYGWLVLLVTVVAGCAPPGLTVIQQVQYQVGDDARWASKDWDDSAWSTASMLDLPDAPGLLWVRAVVQVSGYQPLGVSVAGVVAREVYWDGVLIGQAGRVGADVASEQVGPVDVVLVVPDSLDQAGPHVLALRVSSFRRPSQTTGLRMQAVVGPYATLLTAPLRSVGVPLLFLGGFLLVALYYGVLFLADRNRWPYLLTAVLCLMVAGLLGAESWRDAVGYTYDLHYIRIAIIEGLTWGVGLLLVGTFVVQFHLPRRWAWVGGVAVLNALVLLSIDDHEMAALAVFACSLTLALAVTAWAVVQQKAGARWAIAGILICLSVFAVARFDFMDEAFFPSFGVLVAGLLTSLGLQTREARHQHEAALATAARLETELLKKHLQPHFLMNTLTSVMEWVETDPDRGVQAIEAVADELRTLAEVSGERLILMRRELALCRAHLEVMSHRKAVTFELVTESVDLEASIPPAVIHTLLENAVTHNAYSEGTVTFMLRETQEGGMRHLTLESPLAALRRTPRAEGGGTTYIRARLAEAFPRQWSFEAGERDRTWVTQIRTPGGVV
ncbi:MAG: hypothetical protein RhofKO_28750 [Rhodothermales bacterium]